MAKKKSGGSKGKGQKKAKKESYLRRKAGSSRKGKNKKQTGGFITAKNMEKKQEAHRKLVSKQISRKDERLNLLEQVKAKYPGKKVGDLQKRFGTLNINRLTDILDGTFESSLWYQARVAKKEALAKEKRARHHGKPKFKRKRKAKRDVSGKVQKVPSRRDGGDGKVQVDQKRAGT